VLIEGVKLKRFKLTSDLSAALIVNPIRYPHALALALTEASFQE
jgi:hypothetical protein